MDSKEARGAKVKYMIVFTDGADAAIRQSSGGYETTESFKDVLKKYRDAEIDVIAIGIGDGASLSFLPPLGTVDAPAVDNLAPSTFLHFPPPLLLHSSFRPLPEPFKGEMPRYGKPRGESPRPRGQAWQPDRRKPSTSPHAS